MSGEMLTVSSVSNSRTAVFTRSDVGYLRLSKSGCGTRRWRPRGIASKHSNSGPDGPARNVRHVWLNTFSFGMTRYHHGLRQSATVFFQAADVYSV